MEFTNSDYLLSDPPKKENIRVPKAPELVANRIRDRIIAGLLREGDLLPSELKLMEEFGVSRPTIREAFRILEAERLVTVSRGARGGAEVHKPDPRLIANYALMVLRAENTTLDEVYQARLSFEPAAARICAENHAERASSILRQILEQEHAAIDSVNEFSAALARFHRALVELSGNRLLVHMALAVHEVVERHQSRVLAMRRITVVNDEIRELWLFGLKSHARLISLIEKGDGNKAANHWRDHMSRSFESWVTGYEKESIADLFPIN